MNKRCLLFLFSLLFLLAACHRQQGYYANPAAVVVSTAHDLTGSPYRYGGRSPEGFDCSGLVWYCYRKAGIVVPATTDDQRKAGEKVTGRWKLKKLQPGDLLFFRVERWLGKPNHVGIYVGNGRMIHASTSRGVVLDSLDNVYWEDSFTYARRIIR